MSKKASKTLIGAFVIGAISLLLIAIAVIGSGRLLSTPSRYVMFFDSSIKGLNAGSPVTFRGVPIGRVAEIQMTGDLDSMQFLIPVYIEVDAKATQNITHSDSLDDEYMVDMVEQGLRGRLNSQSLLTGQLLIELDFFPQSGDQTPSAKIAYFNSLPVIPTIPSQLETIWQRIADLPIDVLADNMTSIATSVDNILKRQDVQELPENLNNALVEARTTLQMLSGAGSAIEGLATQLASVVGKVDEQTPNTLRQMKGLLENYTRLANTVDTSLNSFTSVIGPNTATMVEFNKALRELTATARAIRSLAGTLERNPESLILGKGVSR